MSDYDEDDTDRDDEQQEEHSPSEWAELRRARTARKKAEQEAAEVKKQMAFLKAGIDPDDQKAKYFVKGYEGDVTAEAIKQEAIAAGFLTVEQPPEPDMTPVDAQDRISNASGGIGAHQAEVATAALDKAFADGGTEGMLQFLAEQGVPINVVQ